MKIILISGERGSGKTTISKNIAKELGFDYYSDFDILKGIEINHNVKDGDNGRVMSINAYKKFFNEHKNEDIVVDAETTILPSEVKQLQNEYDIDAVFLGFDGIDEEELMKPLSISYPDLAIDELKNQVRGLLDLGKKIKLLCEEENIKFESINTNRELVINNLTVEFVEKYK
jgi:hypothetical protein